MAIDLATLGLEIDGRPIIQARRELDRFSRGARDAEGATTRLGRASDVLGGIMRRLAGIYASYQLAAHIKDSAMLAARYETLGVVMRVAGNNAGYTNSQMLEFQKTLTATGISMIQSRQALTSLAVANIDLAKATDLARAAQNLAVVGNLNSSEALQSLIHGIRSAETEVLQTIGLNVKFEQGYEKLARTLNKATNSLSENEKMQARTIQVLAEASRYNGIYEESLDTAGKKIGSMSRLLEDLKVKAGAVFLPVLSESVDNLTSALKAANEELERQGQKNGTLDVAGEMAATVFKKLVNGALSAGEQVLAKTRAIGTYFAAIGEGTQAVLRGEGMAGWQRAMRAASEQIRDISRQSIAFRDGLYANERAAKAAASGQKAYTEEQAKADMQQSMLAQRQEQNRIQTAEQRRAEEEAEAKRAAAAEAAAKAGEKAAKVYQDLIKDIKEKIRVEELATATNGSLTQSEEYAAEIRSQLADGTLRLTATEKARVNAMLESYTAAERSRIAMEKRQEAIEDAARADAEAIEDLEERNKSLREEIASYGLSTKAINDNTIARLEWEITNRELSSTEVAAREAKISLLKEQSSLQQDLASMELATERANEEKRAYEDQMKSRITETVKAQEGIDQVFREGFAAMLNAGTGSWKAWTQSLKTTFKTTVADEIYKLFAKPFVVQMVGSFAGMLGMGSGSGGGVLSAAGNAIGGQTGSALNLLSSAKSLYSAFSNGSMGSLAGYAGRGVSYIGNMLGNNSIYSFGQGLQGFSAGGVGSGIAPGASGMGASVAPFVNLAGGIAGGIFGGRAISNGYSLNGGSGNSTVNIGTAIGTAIAGPIGAVVGGLLGGVVNRAFGRGPKEVQDTGIRGTLSGAGVNGQNYSNWKQEGGWFRSDKRGTDVTGFSEDLAKQFNEGFVTMSRATEQYAQALGVTGEGMLASYSKAFDIKLTNDQAANEKALADLFAQVGDEMAQRLVPNLMTFAKSGETASAVLARLSEQFAATNQVAMVLGRTATEMFGGTGIDTAAARERLVEMAGGVEALAASASAYAQNFMTEAERLVPVQKALTESLTALGYASVDTREEFKSTIDGLIASGAINTTEGAKTLAGLLALSEAFALVHPQVEDLTGAIEDNNDALAEMERILDQRKDLERQLNELVMTAAQLREEERKEIDASNHAIFDAITATRALREANEILVSGLETALADAQEQARAALEGVRRAVEARKEVLREEYELAVESARARHTLAVEAKQQEISIANERVQAMQTLYDRIKGTVKQVNALTVDQAQGVLEGALAAAKAGQRLDQVPGLEDALQAISDRSTDSYSSREDFLRAQYASGRVLEELSTHAGGQLSVAELQLKAQEDSLKQLQKMHQEELDALQDKYEADVATAERMYTFAQSQLDALNGTYANTTTMAEAMKAMEIALVNLAKAQDAMPPKATTPSNPTGSAISHLYENLLGRPADQAGLDFYKNAVNSGSTLDDVAKGITTSMEYYERQVGGLYQSLLGRAGDSGGIAFYAKNLASGATTLGAIADSIKASAEYKTLKGYAGGGMKPAGLAMVGELGPEVVATGPARVWSHDQMSDAFGGRETPALLRKLLAEVTELRKEQRVGDQAVVIAVKDQTKLFRDVTDEGTALLTKAAD